MTPAWRELFRQMDAAASEQVLAWLLAAVVGAVIGFGGGLAFHAGLQRAATPTTPEQFYCRDEASATAAKCPPEPGTKVVATYPGGLVATLTWQDGRWWQHLPGGKVIEAPMPHDWRLP